MHPHTPVLLEEVLHYLNPQSGGHFIDVTLGAGGHAAAILERTAPDGRLLAIDQDAEALALARERLATHESRTVFVQANFSEIADVAASEGFPEADGVLADLGVSSMMLDQAERGFSFQSDGPLDMRMDQRQELTASDIVNHTKERELADIIYQLGEERRSRPLARAIVRSRPHHSTHDLVRAIESVSGKPRYGQIHPATRTFMALRLAVNDELAKLEKFLDLAPGLLRRGGRMVVISFHSLEDRIVKHRMRAQGGVLTKKVIRAQDTERYQNPRARSAKLRALERN
jgi:16S rRNA (cytosine1402-N4)-methyltransferase